VALRVTAFEGRHSIQTRPRSYPQGRLAAAAKAICKHAPIYKISAFQVAGGSRWYRDLGGIKLVEKLASHLQNIRVSGCMAEQSTFARRMMAQKLMAEKRDDPFSDSRFFAGKMRPSMDDIENPTRLSDMAGPAYGAAATGSLFAPGAGIADVMGYAPDPMQSGQMLPSFGENIGQGNYLDAGFQTLGAAGDVALAAGAVFPPALPGAVALGTMLKAPRAARVAGAVDVAADAAKTDPNQAAGAAMEAAQARYFETGKFEPPTAENPVSIVPPTPDEPGIIAFHGSGADFDEFRLEMIGTGEGAQAYGYGLYFTDSEDIAKFYRESISRGKSGIPQSVPDNPEDIAGNLALDINFNKGVFGDTKQLQINSSDPDYDFYIETLNDNAVGTTQAGAGKTFEFTDGSIISLLDETMPVFNGKALDSVYTSDVQDVFGAEIADIAQRAKDMGMPGTLEELTDDVTTVLSQLGQGLGSKRDMSMAVESLAPSYQGPPSRFKTIYNQFIEPKSTIETTSTVTELGSKKGKMYKVGLAPKPDELLDYDKSLRQQPQFLEALKPLYDEFGVAETSDVGTFFEVVKNTKRTDNLPSGITPQGLSERLAAAGIPGIKYRAAGSRATSTADEAVERNYVIFDDKAVNILEKYGIAGPVLVTGAVVGASKAGNDNEDSGSILPDAGII